MGIANQVERLREINQLIRGVAWLRPLGLEALARTWWVRLRPDGRPCSRCVMIRQCWQANAQPESANEDSRDPDTTIPNVGGLVNGHKENSE